MFFDQTTAVPTRNTVGPIFIVGNVYKFTPNLQGSISELIYFNNMLNTNDRRIVECYLSSKYSISLNQLSSACN